MMTGDFETADEMSGSKVAPASTRDAMDGRNAVRFQIVSCFLALRRAWARAVPILPKPRREISDDMLLMRRMKGWFDLTKCFWRSCCLYTFGICFHVNNPPREKLIVNQWR